MKKFLQIQDGMVLICGPSTTGKSTLAKKIINETPYQDKVLVSHDEILRNYLRERGYPEEKFYTGLAGEENDDFKACVIKLVRDALHERKFVVYESLYCNLENLAMLIATLPTLELNRPLTLIKMWPSLQLQMQFLSKRPDRHQADMRAILSQRGTFKEAVHSQRFAEEAEWIKEYTVEDPREVELEFAKLRELTKQLLAAYENYEELCEKCPEIVQTMRNV